MKYKSWIPVALFFLSAFSGSASADWEAQLRLENELFIPACYTSRINGFVNLNDFWVDDSGELFAVGQSSVILHHDASGWKDMTVDKRLDFYAVWGTSSDNIMAVGAAGSVFHFNGVEWREMRSATFRPLSDVWGASANDVYAVGENGAIIHYNGSYWTGMASWSNDDICYIHGNSSTDIFAVGRYGTVLHCDGGRWEKLTEDSDNSEPEYSYFDQVWGDSHKNLYGLSFGRVFHFNGELWTRLICDFGAFSFKAVWGAGNEACFLGTDEDGKDRIVCYDGKNWREISTLEMPISPHIVSWYSANEIYMKGHTESIRYRGNEFYRYDGNSWELIGSEASLNTFNGVWGADETDVFAVGEKGMLYHYDGNGWQETVSGIDTDLNDIWGSGPDNVIAIGDQGEVLHYDGVQWERVESGTKKNLNAVWGDTNGNVYMVGDGGTIVRYDGKACALMDGGTDRDLTGIWVGESGTVYVVGKGAVFLIYREGVWTPSDSLSVFTDWPGYRLSIWGSSDTDMYACGVDGSISRWCLHYDGSAWDNVEDTWITAEMLWGRSDDDVFAALKGDTYISHFDGMVWTLVTPMDSFGVCDVWANESDIFIVGENGTIIHSSRQDNTPPKILFVSPENGATDAQAGDKWSFQFEMIEILFSEPIASDLTISIKDAAGNQISPAPGSFFIGSSMVRGNVLLEPETTYTVTVSSQVKDFAGNAMGEDYQWSFTTAQSEEAPEPVIEGAWITSDLWIGAQFNTGDQGKFEGRWRLGGEDTTARGDRVIWGYFYAAPEDVSWGNEDNPDLFVKIWFDVSGSLYISYFHVSVPEIQVWSNYPQRKEEPIILGSGAVATMSDRHIGDFYYYRPESKDYWHTQQSQFEDGRPQAGDNPKGMPVGNVLTEGLRIGAVINTEDKGPIEGLWRLGGQATTQRGDQVLWGYFYADPNIMSWGSTENPDLFVKAWYDVSGAVFLDFFHVSVPDIEVFSVMPITNTYDNKGTTILGNRFIEHRYQR